MVSAQTPSTEATPAKKEKSDVEKALDYFKATEAIHGENHPETAAAAKLLEQARAQRDKARPRPMASKVTRAAQDKLSSKRSEYQEAENQAQAAAEAYTAAQLRHEEALRHFESKRRELREADDAAQESKLLAANAETVATLARARAALATLLPQG